MRAAPPGTAMTTTTKETTGASGLTTREEGRLVRRARRGDAEALRELVDAHLPMVKYMVRRSPVKGCSLADLQQQGQLGLLHAVRVFDPNRGVRFWTYARWWVRAYIKKYAWQNRRIVPLSSSRANRRVALNLRKVESRLGADGSAERIAQELSVDEEVVCSVQAALNGGDISLDEPTSGRGISAATPSPEEEVDRLRAEARRVRLVYEALDELDPRDREIVERRFLCEEPETLACVGKRLGISRERVRQLSERALARLREAVTARDGAAAELVTA